jgi:hypothetical protein
MSGFILIFIWYMVFENFSKLSDFNMIYMLYLILLFIIYFKATIDLMKKYYNGKKK